MTNYDKIKNESIEGIASLIASFEFNNVDECKKCFRYNTFERWKEAIKWLHEEIEPTLSEAERVILENIYGKYKWIARDGDEKLYVYTNRPSKSTFFNDWNSDGGAGTLSIFSHLFQFITWEDSEPYNIQELLEENK